MDIDLGSEMALNFIESIDNFHDSVLDSIDLGNEFICITFDEPYVRKLGRYLDKKVSIFLQPVHFPGSVSKFEVGRLMNGVQVVTGKKASVILEALDGESISLEVKLSKCRLVTSITGVDLGDATFCA